MLKDMLGTAPFLILLIVIISVFIGSLQGARVLVNISLLANIENSIKTANYSNIVTIGLFVFLNAFFETLFYVYTSMESYINNIISNRITKKYLQNIYDKTTRVDFTKYEDPKLYDVINESKMGIDNNSFMNVVKFITFIPFFITNIVSILIFMGYHNPFLMLIILVSLIPVFITRILNSKGLYKLKKENVSKERYIESLWNLICGTNSAHECKLYNSYDYIYDKYENGRNEIVKKEWKYNVKHFITVSSFDSLRPVGIAIAIIFSAYLTISGRIQLGVLIVLITTFSQLQIVIGSFFDAIANVIDGNNYLKTLRIFLEQPVEQNAGQNIDRVKQGITLKNVSFAYPLSKQPALRNINLHLKTGEKIALVGENGAGKSTLSNIILGLYTPDSGEVFYDGIERKNINKESLWKKCSAVFQNSIHYNMTVRENVALGDITKIDNKEMIEKQLEEEGLLTVFQKHDTGIETFLGKEYGGIDISGGEWQKLAIARGSIKDTDVIILDEPTASFDPIFEYNIFKDFWRLFRQNISIVVTHRIGAARLADRIIVLKDGQIIEDGSYDDLMKNRGEFFKMYNMQKQWYERENTDGGSAGVTNTFFTDKSLS
jgi:ABC-type multidrug transport system fused ATPase/permease subunit